MKGYISLRIDKALQGHPSRLEISSEKKSWRNKINGSSHLKLEKLEFHFSHGWRDYNSSVIEEVKDILCSYLQTRGEDCSSYNKIYKCFFIFKIYPVAADAQTK